MNFLGIRDKLDPPSSAINKKRPFAMLCFRQLILPKS